MIVMLYTPRHRPKLDALLQMHNQPAGQLPALGCVVLNGPVLAAAGFLRQVEGSGYFFDSLISNPSLNSEQRHEAMTLLWARIIELAAGKPLLGYSVNDGTINRALATGFHALPHTVLVHKGTI